MTGKHLLGLLVLVSTGCDDALVYQRDTLLPENGWRSKDRPEFCFEITDTLRPHDLFIDVRHTGDYAYSDLFLFLDLTGPDGHRFRDTVECTLADPSGRWYGRGTGFLFADRFKAHVLFRTGNRFPHRGRYCIRMEQAMRTDPLPGITDVGVSVVLSKAQGG
ncbi:MAG: gliding motility lipoprotein GldH [Flavobacteriales bacterium]|nr:gliding motility lipoprotein GldH [Flavobacteriales bacterium]MCB9167032.1 gliding motility lipoprotein GldH [Flavobacteriales bacterium]